jgi:hypothetical protein
LDRLAQFFVKPIFLVSSAREATAGGWTLGLEEKGAWFVIQGGQKGEAAETLCVAESPCSSQTLVVRVRLQPADMQLLPALFHEAATGALVLFSSVGPCAD